MGLFDEIHSPNLELEKQLEQQRQKTVTHTRLPEVLEAIQKGEAIDVVGAREFTGHDEEGFAIDLPTELQRDRGNYTQILYVDEGNPLEGDIKPEETLDAKRIFPRTFYAINEHQGLKIYQDRINFSGSTPHSTFNGPFMEALGATARFEPSANVLRIAPAGSTLPPLPTPH